MSVRLRSCIVQGRQRSYRWTQIRQQIPADDVALRVVDSARLFNDKDTDDAKDSILELARALEAGWSIEQLVEHQFGRRFGVLDQLTSLLERGALATVEAGATALPTTPREAPGKSDHKTAAARPAATAESFARAALAHQDAGDAHKALELAYRALRIEPQNPKIQKLHGTLERSVFAELSREFLTSFRVPELLVARDQLDSLDLSGTERYLAGRVDGRWDLLSLMRVAPVRDVEALITFKRLADRGIISL